MVLLRTTRRSATAAPSCIAAKLPSAQLIEGVVGANEVRPFVRSTYPADCWKSRGMYFVAIKTSVGTNIVSNISLADSPNCRAGKFQ